jgi:hypothetical protein
MVLNTILKCRGIRILGDGGRLVESGRNQKLGDEDLVLIWES